MEASAVRGTLEAGWPELVSVLAEHDADPVGGGLAYSEMSAIARFLADKLRSGETERLAAFFRSVERCLLEGDHRAVELVVVGLLEDLQNSNVTQLDDYPAWVPFLGPQSRRAWQAVEDFWSGDVGAISRFAGES